MSPVVGPFPFLPRDFHGLLLKKDDDYLVFWIQSRRVEPASEGSASELAVQAMQAIIPSLHGPKLADVVRQLEDHGYRLTGDRRFNFKSGELIQDAYVLASIASQTGSQNTELAGVHDGTNPPLDHEDWAEWELVTRYRNAACKGARVLGMASLEAFVNEVLSQQFPDLYKKLEEKMRAAPFQKLKVLCESLSIALDGVGPASRALSARHLSAATARGHPDRTPRP